MDAWKATFETNMRESIQDYRSKILAQLQLHSERTRALQTPVRLDEEYAGFVRKLTVLNLELEKVR